MKVSTYLCIFIGAMGLNITVQATERAEQLYQKGDYKEALAKYREKSSPSRADLYAMGACAYHLENFPQALAYWRKAEQGAGFKVHAALDAGIQRIYERMGKEYYVTRGQRFKRVLMMIPLLFFQIIGLMGLVMQFLFRTYLAQRRWMLISLRLAIIFCFITMYQFDDSPRAVVRNVIAVRAGPSLDYPSVGELAAIDEVVVEDKEDTWYKIKRSGLKGWVENKAVELV